MIPCTLLPDLDNKIIGRFAVISYLHDDSLIKITHMIILTFSFRLHKNNQLSLLFPNLLDTFTLFHLFNDILEKRNDYFNLISSIEYIRNVRTSRLIALLRSRCLGQMPQNHEDYPVSLHLFISIPNPPLILSPLAAFSGVIQAFVILL